MELRVSEHDHITFCLQPADTDGHCIMATETVDTAVNQKQAIEKQSNIPQEKKGARETKSLCISSLVKFGLPSDPGTKRRRMPTERLDPALATTAAEQKAAFRALLKLSNKTSADDASQHGEATTVGNEVGGKEDDDGIDETPQHGTKRKATHETVTAGEVVCEVIRAREGAENDMPGGVERRRGPSRAAASKAPYFSTEVPVQQRAEKPKTGTSKSSKRPKQKFHMRSRVEGRWNRDPEYYPGRITKCTFKSGRMSGAARKAGSWHYSILYDDSYYENQVPEEFIRPFRRKVPHAASAVAPTEKSSSVSSYSKFSSKAKAQAKSASSPPLLNPASILLSMRWSFNKNGFSSSIGRRSSELDAGNEEVEDEDDDDSVGGDRGTQNWVQCSDCDRWRRLPESVCMDRLWRRQSAKPFVCHMNLWDPANNWCGAPEAAHPAISIVASSGNTVSAPHRDAVLSARTVQRAGLGDAAVPFAIAIKDAGLGSLP